MELNDEKERVEKENERRSRHLFDMVALRTAEVRMDMMACECECE